MALIRPASGMDPADLFQIRAKYVLESAAISKWEQELIATLCPFGR